MNNFAASHVTALLVTALALPLLLLAPTPLSAQQASRSAWEAADFRVWGFVPYWTPQAQINAFATDGVYDHVSDVLYFSGVRPTASGALSYHANANGHLAALKSHQAQFGFRYHMSMFDVSGGTVETVWNAITNNASTRATFVNNVKQLLLDNNMTGFNFDWERPDTVAEWANYTQLAKDMRAAINPLGMEISVDDYGYASTLWDNTPVFDARTYDQLFIMGYHDPAFGNGNLNNDYFANTKLALTGQGAEKAFVNEQLVIGIGTWGADGPATVSLKNIVGVNPNLPADALTFTGTVADINGTLRTGTWNIESRYQVREKTQLALDRNMAGMMSWTLHYDATNQLSLHRVMHHYLVFKKNVPDLNLDGRVDAADANDLADHMGTVPGWTGTNTAARFEDFYISGNWEQGDRDGNGFVNQNDANWLASRFMALGVNLPDRLAYTGTFEAFQDAKGINGRWRGIRDGQNLRETGNYTQHAADHLTFAGSGAGFDKHSEYSVTIRNQNAAEAFDSLNTQPRGMQADFSTPIDLGTESETYVSFLVRQNTGSLLPSQLASNGRSLSLTFLDGIGVGQFEFSFFGKQEEWSVRSLADAGGEIATGTGFEPDSTFLFVGKLSGNGAGGNTMQASLLPSGSVVGNFTDANFDWMITANGSAAYNPVISQLLVTSLHEANYTISNIWMGAATDFFTPTPQSLGDYNGNGTVDAADYIVWRDSMGQSGPALAADGNGDLVVDADDHAIWTANFGKLVGSGGFTQSSHANTAVPEPSTLLLAAAAAIMGFAHRRR